MNIDGQTHQAKLLAAFGEFPEFEGRFVPLDGKRPVSKKWNTSKGLTLKAAKARLEAGHNVGIQPPEGWAVIDFDPRNTDDAERAFKAFCSDFDFDPAKYFEVTTGSGGKHWYVRIPLGLSLRGKVKGHPAFDIKSGSGQCVAPGSIHPTTGQLYRVTSAVDLREVGDTPAKLLKALQRADTDAAAGKGGDYNADQLRDMLTGLAPVDFRAHDAAHGEPAWLPLMQACHHATAGTGREEFIAWSVSDPEYRDQSEVIGQRWDSLSDKPGAVTASYLFAQLKRVGRDDLIPLPDLDSDFSELDDEEETQAQTESDLPQPHHRFVESRKRARYLLDNMIPAQGVVNVFGKPGDGKSTWVYSLAWALAEGRKEFMGKRLRGNGPLPVLYLPFEGRALLDEHHIAHATHFGTQPETLFLPRTDYDLRTRDSDGWKKLGKHVKALGVKVVIIDTLSQAIGGEDENGQGAVGFLSALTKLANDNDLCAIFLHHPTKANPRDARGSGALTGNVDNQLFVSGRGCVEIQKDKLRGVSGVQHYFASELVTVPDGLDEEGEERFVQGVVVTSGVDAEPDRLEHQGVYDALADWMLARDEGPMSPRAICGNARAFGASSSAVRDAVYSDELVGGVLTSNDCVLRSIPGNKGGCKIILEAMI